MSAGRDVDLNLFFLAAPGAAGEGHKGHNNSAHTAHSIVTNPVTYVLIIWDDTSLCIASYSL